MDLWQPNPQVWAEAKAWGFWPGGAGPGWAEPGQRRVGPGRAGQAEVLYPVNSLGLPVSV